MKKIVGIIANTVGFDSNNPFDDKYFVQNQYIDAVKKYGGIPIIISAVNLKINKDALDLCDSFIMTGGKRYHKYHYDVVDYAIKSIAEDALYFSMSDTFNDPFDCKVVNDGLVFEANEKDYVKCVLQFADEILLHCNDFVVHFFQKYDFNQMQLEFL